MMEWRVVAMGWYGAMMVVLWMMKRGDRDWLSRL
jgi:hypothetical protein